MKLKNIPVHEEIQDNLEERFIEAWNIAFKVASFLKRECNAEEIRITVLYCIVRGFIKNPTLILP